LVIGDDRSGRIRRRYDGYLANTERGTIRWRLRHRQEAAFPSIQIRPSLQRGIGFLRAAIRFANRLPLPLSCTFVQLFAGQTGAHHISRQSAHLGSTAYAPLRLARTPGENKCDALHWGSF
jgi:hypothetical protein